MTTEHELTWPQIKSLTPPATGATLHSDGDNVPGLALRITANDVRSFVLTYRSNGTQKCRTLGRLTKDNVPNPELKIAQIVNRPQRMNLKQARNAANYLRANFIQDGKDPFVFDQLDDESNGTGSDPTLTRYAKDWLDNYASAHLRESTQRCVKSILNRHILPISGSKHLAEITGDDVELMMHKIKRRVGHGGQANRAHSYLRMILNRATKSKLITKNPCKDVKRFAEYDPRERYLLPQEFLRLVEVLENHPNQQSARSIQLMLLTGSRRGEVLGLRWSEIDFERGNWTKPSSRVKQKRKSKIALNSEALTILRKIRSEQEQHGESEFVFPGDGRDGVRVELKTFWKSVKVAAKLPDDFRMHDLRHSYASLLAEAGTPLKMIGTLLGHANTTTTDRYAHISDQGSRKATEEVGRMFREAQRKAQRAAAKRKETVAGRPTDGGHRSG
jgi:integrase